MSMFPSECSQSPVYNPDRFKTDEDVASYVISEHLRGAVAGEPFLLITRFLKNQMYRSGLHPIYHNNLVETCYFGKFSDKKPLVYFQKDKRHDVGRPGFFMTSVSEDCISLATDSYVEIESLRSLAIHKRELALGLRLMSETKLKGTFRPPEGQCLPFLMKGLEEMSAFSFAVGRADMEHLCLAESDVNSEMLVGYIRATALLKIPLLSKRMQEERGNFGRKFIGELLAEHQKLASAQYPHQEDRASMVSRLSLALEVGLDKDAWDVRVGGIRYRPCDLVPDLVALYPEKPAQK